MRIQVPPSQFLNVIISQRFRTVTDRDLVSAIYEHVFREPAVQKNYFHNLGTDFYQVGLAYLPRDRVLQRFHDSHLKVYPDDLPIIESLLLCIGQEWPTILVGPSGCGKTATLRKVAAISGAQLVEVALNADTDTMDLIGGFEQVDNQRQVSSFIEEFSWFLQQQVIQEHITNEGLSEPFFELLLEMCEIMARDPEPLEQFLEPLCKRLEHTSSQRFYHFHKRCVELRDILNSENKVGFEWTEGIFVQAVQRGHWVVLENANLCNPCVLDRLNSLMEQNGCLILNEQRTADGSARLVKPHPNFRLFLTMDPRHGELSRAMRNRAIEICFLSKDKEATFVPPEISYLPESLIYRFRSFQNFDWSHASLSKDRELFEIALDHLSSADLDQLHRSLPGFSSLWEAGQASSQELVHSTVRRYISLLEKDGSVAFGGDHVSKVLGEGCRIFSQTSIEVCCTWAPRFVQANES
jgi:midasin